MRLPALVAVGVAGALWPMLTVVFGALARDDVGLLCLPIFACSVLLLAACALHARGIYSGARVLVLSMVVGAIVVVVGPFYQWPNAAYVPRDTFVAIGIGAAVSLACIYASWRAGRNHELASWWAAGAVAVTTCWLVGLYAWPASTWLS